MSESTQPAHLGTSWGLLVTGRLGGAGKWYPLLLLLLTSLPQPPSIPPSHKPATHKVENPFISSAFRTPYLSYLRGEGRGGDDGGGGSSSGGKHGERERSALQEEGEREGG